MKGDEPSNKNPNRTYGIIRCTADASGNLTAESPVYTYTDSSVKAQKGLAAFENISNISAFINDLAVYEGQVIAVRPIGYRSTNNGNDTYHAFGDVIRADGTLIHGYSLTTDGAAASPNAMVPARVLAILPKKLIISSGKDENDAYGTLDFTSGNPTSTIHHESGSSGYYFDSIVSGSGSIRLEIAASD